MPRYIDADALKKDLTRFYDNEVTARELIDEQPTADVQPVKHGRWIENSDPGQNINEHYMCSECGCTFHNWANDNYCPNCGCPFCGVQIESNSITSVSLNAFEFNGEYLLEHNDIVVEKKKDGDNK